jgi:hypothetical protein
MAGSRPTPFEFSLCADDYGFTPAVSVGILETALAGRLSAASAMTSRPDWPRAAAEWRRAAPPCALGLHVTLTVGAPLVTAPLADEERFAPLGRWIAPALAGRLPQAALEAEIGAQIDVFIAHFSGPPSHIDGHQHIHGLPGVRGALLAALAARGLSHIPVRDSADAPARILARRAMALKALQVRALTGGLRRALGQGARLNDGFSGFSNFQPQADYAAQFETYLTAPGPRHLVMCHPGYVDDELRRLDPATVSRIAELRFLNSAAFVDLCAKRGARLRHAPSA